MTTSGAVGQQGYVKLCYCWLKTNDEERRKAREGSEREGEALKCRDYGEREI